MLAGLCPDIVLGKKPPRQTTDAARWTTDQDRRRDSQIPIPVSCSLRIRNTPYVHFVLNSATTRSHQAVGHPGLLIIR